MCYVPSYSTAFLFVRHSFSILIYSDPDGSLLDARH